MKNIIKKIQALLIPLVILVLFLNIGCASLSHYASAATMDGMGNHSSEDIHSIASMQQDDFSAHQHDSHHLVKYSEGYTDYSKILISTLPANQRFLPEMIPQTALPLLGLKAVSFTLSQTKTILRC